MFLVGAYIYGPPDPTGCCEVPGFANQPGTLQHLANEECHGLHSSLGRDVTLWKIFILVHPILIPVIMHYSLGPPETFLAFLVDTTTKPLVISLT